MSASVAVFKESIIYLRIAHSTDVQAVSISKGYGKRKTFKAKGKIAKHFEAVILVQRMNTSVGANLRLHKQVLCEYFLHKVAVTF